MNEVCPTVPADAGGAACCRRFTLQRSRTASRTGPARSRAGAGAAVLAALLACEDGAAPAGPAHPWLQAPPKRDPGAVVLPSWLVYPVAEHVREEAVAALADEPYIQLSPGMASHFAGREVRVPMEMRPFLVRAVASPGAAIEVVQSIDGLWLRALGAAARDAEAAPQVVLLDPTPQDIFATLEPAPADAPQPAADGLLE